MSLRSLALLSLCVFLTACNKINQENYSQLKAGMAKAEVEKLLGTEGVLRRSGHVQLYLG